MTKEEKKDSAYIYIKTILIICFLIIIGGLIWFTVAMINNKPQQVGFAVCVMLLGWGIANTNIGFYRIARKEKRKMSDGPIITEELWNRWHKTEEKEEIDSSEEIETFKNDFKNNQEEFINKAYEKTEKVKEEMVIDDILLIHSHHYENYEEYIESKKRQIEAIRQENQKNTKSFFEGEPIYNFTIYVEPIILSEETFNYIIEKRGIKRK